MLARHETFVTSLNAGETRQNAGQVVAHEKGTPKIFTFTIRKILDACIYAIGAIETYMWRSYPIHDEKLCIS
jgi:hypothetical protein